MKNPHLVFLRLVVFVVCATITKAGFAQNSADTVFATVSMDAPHTHYYQVEMDFNSNGAQNFEVKMPVWTPGYYWMLNFAKNVTSFSATDENDNPLQFLKTDLNTWQIKAGDAKRVKISYDVYAYERSVADPWLDDGRAFIQPTGVFMFSQELIQTPVVLQVNPYNEWSTVTTGLDCLNEKEHIYRAEDFDVLYDSPILAGNMEILSFEVDGIPYTISMENPAEFDRETYIGDFKKIVKSATSLMGDIPYSHYSFLIMDQGFGGLEHRNSMAVFSNSNYDVTNSRGYQSWLAFIAHEFFHLYNVKRIRPIELGPFDYCNENLTNMLWVAEGLTVYYEYMVLNRAGLMSQQEVLDAYSKTIANFENANGRKYLTARQSSYDTWLNFFNWNNHTDNTTISYYDIGNALGMLLDLKIRYETDGEKSLEDVMRTIYNDFHKKQNRGYTDEEFREVCETIAGCSLEEIFHYAEITGPMDYQKYLDYVGVKMNLTSTKTVSYGLTVRKAGEGWQITDIDRNSPAWQIGLSINDQILAINGTAANETLIGSLTHPEKQGEITLKVKRRSGEKEFTIPTFEQEWCDYKMQVKTDINDKQKQLLESWILEK
ncbi:PDZ domain-containing protein [uncultured Draconibacterium sp.]|uniref:M61 family metallopeptidase n=1 Tax=uncultured Draconibacterium sp. TaxID=1573823 RepID=UPI0029C730DB|nr:PDZ domain-containing protein [uncultured Draconibacterium sp.]